MFVEWLTLCHHAPCLIWLFCVVWLQWSWDHYVSMLIVSGFFWQFSPWLITQDLHKSHNGMIFSNRARLLLDFSRVFQNGSSCEIMWKVKQFLFICLSGYGSCHICQAWCHARSEEVSTNDPRRDFQDRLFSSGLSITELIFVTSYASY